MADYNSGSKRSAADAFDSDSEDKNLGSPNSGLEGKKTRGRVKIAMKFIENKLRRYTTFSKRKTGIMKKAYELSTLTGTQVMLLVASETGHVYTFATRKLQPMITSESGKALIQTCLNSPDIASLGSGDSSHDLSTAELVSLDEDDRMNPGGFEETGINYTVEDDQPKVLDLTMVSGGQLSISPSPSPVARPARSGFSDGSSSDNQQSPPPMTIAPQTISFNSYLGPPTGQMANGGKVTNMTMQLPRGYVATAPGTPLTLAPMSSAAVHYTQAPAQATTASVQYKPSAAVSPAGMFSLQGFPGLSALSPVSSPASSSTGQQALATMPSIGSGGSGQPMLYQTAQGMVYAAAGLPEGYVLNLPQTPTYTTQDATAAGQAAPVGTQQQQHYITIPVPVSLATGQMYQPFLQQVQQQVQQQVLQQAQQVHTKVERK